MSKPKGQTRYFFGNQPLSSRYLEDWLEHKSEASQSANQAVYTEFTAVNKDFLATCVLVSQQQGADQKSSSRELRDASPTLVEWNEAHTAAPINAWKKDAWDKRGDLLRAASDEYIDVASDIANNIITGNADEYFGSGGGGKTFQPAPGALRASSCYSAQKGLYLHVWQNQKAARRFVVVYQRLTTANVEQRLGLVIPQTIVFHCHGSFVTLTSLVPIQTEQKGSKDAPAPVSISLAQMSNALKGKGKREGYDKTHTALAFDNLRRLQMSLRLTIQNDLIFHVTKNGEAVTVLALQPCVLEKPGAPFGRYEVYQDAPSNADLNSMASIQKYVTATPICANCCAALMTEFEVRQGANTKPDELIKSNILATVMHGHGINVRMMYLLYFQIHSEMKDHPMASAARSLIAMEMVFRTLKDVIRAQFVANKTTSIGASDAIIARANVVNRLLYYLLDAPEKDQVWEQHIMGTMKKKFMCGGFQVPLGPIIGKMVALLQWKFGLSMDDKTKSYKSFRSAFLGSSFIAQYEVLRKPLVGAGSVANAWLKDELSTAEKTASGHFKNKQLTRLAFLGYAMGQKALGDSAKDLLLKAIEEVTAKGKVPTTPVVVLSGVVLELVMASEGPASANSIAHMNKFFSLTLHYFNLSKLILKDLDTDVLKARKAENRQRYRRRKDGKLIDLGNAQSGEEKKEEEDASDPTNLRSFVDSALCIDALYLRSRQQQCIEMLAPLNKSERALMTMPHLYAATAVTSLLLPQLSKKGAEDGGGGAELVRLDNALDAVTKCLETLQSVVAHDKKFFLTSKREKDVDGKEPLSVSSTFQLYVPFVIRQFDKSTHAAAAKDVLSKLLDTTHAMVQVGTDALCMSAAPSDVLEVARCSLKSHRNVAPADESFSVSAAAHLVCIAGMLNSKDYTMAPVSSNNKASDAAKVTTTERGTKLQWSLKEPTETGNSIDKDNSLLLSPPLDKIKGATKTLQGIVSSSKTFSKPTADLAANADAVLHGLMNAQQWAIVVQTAPLLLPPSSSALQRLQRTRAFAARIRQSIFVDKIDGAFEPTDFCFAMTQRRLRAQGYAKAIGIVVMEHMQRYNLVLTPIVVELEEHARADITAHEDAAALTLAKYLTGGVEQRKLESAEEKLRQEIENDFFGGEETAALYAQLFDKQEAMFRQWVECVAMGAILSPCFDTEEAETCAGAAEAATEQTDVIGGLQILGLVAPSWHFHVALAYEMDESFRVIVEREETQAFDQIEAQFSTGAARAALDKLEDLEAAERRIFLTEQIEEMKQLLAQTYCLEFVIPALMQEEKRTFQEITMSFENAAVNAAIDRCESDEETKRLQIVESEASLSVHRYFLEMEEERRDMYSQEALTARYVEMLVEFQDSIIQTIIAEEAKEQSEFTALLTSTLSGAFIGQAIEEEERWRLLILEEEFKTFVSKLCLPFCEEFFTAALSQEDAAVRRRIRNQHEAEIALANMAGFDTMENQQRTAVWDRRFTELINEHLFVLEADIRGTTLKDERIASSTHFVALQDSIRQSIRRLETKEWKELTEDTAQDMLQQHIDLLVADEKKRRATIRSNERAAISDAVEEGEEIVRDGILLAQDAAFERFLGSCSDTLDGGAREKAWADCYLAFHEGIWVRNCVQRSELVARQESEQRGDIIWAEEYAERVRLCIQDLEARLREATERQEDRCFSRLVDEYKEVIATAFLEEIEADELYHRRLIRFGGIGAYTAMLEELELSLREVIALRAFHQVGLNIQDFRRRTIDAQVRSFAKVETAMRTKIWNKNIAERLDLWVQLEDAERSLMLHDFRVQGVEIIEIGENNFRQALRSYEQERWGYLMYRFDDRQDIISTDIVVAEEFDARAIVWQKQRKELCEIAEEEDTCARQFVVAHEAEERDILATRLAQGTEELIFIDFCSFEATQRTIILRSQITAKIAAYVECEESWRVCLQHEHKEAKHCLVAHFEDVVRFDIERNEEAGVNRILEGFVDLLFMKQERELVDDEKARRVAVRNEATTGVRDLLDVLEQEARALLVEGEEDKQRLALYSIIVGAKYDLLFAALLKEESKTRALLNRTRISEEIEFVNCFFEDERKVLAFEAADDFLLMLDEHMEPSRRGAFEEFERTLRHQTMQMCVSTGYRIRMREIEEEEQRQRYDDVLEPLYFDFCLEMLAIKEEGYQRTHFVDLEETTRHALIADRFASIFAADRERVLGLEVTQREELQRRSDQIYEHLFKLFAVEAKAVLIDGAEQTERCAILEQMAGEVIEKVVFDAETEELEEIWRGFVQEGFPVLSRQIFDLEEQKRSTVVEADYYGESLVLLEDQSDDWRRAIRQHEREERTATFNAETKKSIWKFLFDCIESSERTERAVVFAEQRLDRVSTLVDPQETEQRFGWLFASMTEERLYHCERVEYERRGLFEASEGDVRKAMVSKVLQESVAIRMDHLHLEEERQRAKLFHENFTRMWTVTQYVQEMWGVPEGKKANRLFINFGVCFRFGVDNGRSAIQSEEARVFLDLRRQWRNFVQKQQRLILEGKEATRREDYIVTERRERLEMFDERWDQHFALNLVECEYTARYRIFMAQWNFFRYDYYEFNERLARDRILRQFRHFRRLVDMQFLQRKEYAGRLMILAAMFTGFYNCVALQKHSEPFERGRIVVAQKDELESLWRRHLAVIHKYERFMLHRQQIISRYKTIAKPYFTMRFEVMFECEEPVQRQALIATKFCEPLMQVHVPRYEERIRNAALKQHEEVATEMWPPLYREKDDLLQWDFKTRLEPAARIVTVREETSYRLRLVELIESAIRQKEIERDQEEYFYLDIANPFNKIYFTLRRSELQIEENEGRRDITVDHQQCKAFEIYQACEEERRWELRYPEEFRERKRLVFDEYLEPRLRADIVDQQHRELSALYRQERLEGKELRFRHFEFVLEVTGRDEIENSNIVGRLMLVNKLEEARHPLAITSPQAEEYEQLSADFHETLFHLQRSQVFLDFQQRAFSSCIEPRIDYILAEYSGAFATEWYDIHLRDYVNGFVTTMVCFEEKIRNRAVSEEASEYNDLRARYLDEHLQLERKLLEEREEQARSSGVVSQEMRWRLILSGIRAEGFVNTVAAEEANELRVHWHKFCKEAFPLQREQLAFEEKFHRSEIRHELLDEYLQTLIAFHEAGLRVLQVGGEEFAERCRICVVELETQMRLDVHRESDQLIAHCFVEKSLDLLRIQLTQVEDDQAEARRCVEEQHHTGFISIVFGSLEYIVRREVEALEAQEHQELLEQFTVELFSAQRLDLCNEDASVRDEQLHSMRRAQLVGLLDARFPEFFHAALVAPEWTWRRQALFSKEPQDETMFGGFVPALLSDVFSDTCLQVHSSSSSSSSSKLLSGSALLSSKHKQVDDEEDRFYNEDNDPALTQLQVLQAKTRRAMKRSVDPRPFAATFVDATRDKYSAGRHTRADLPFSLDILDREHLLVNLVSSALHTTDGAQFTASAAASPTLSSRSFRDEDISSHTAAVAALFGTSSEQQQPSLLPSQSAIFSPNLSAAASPSTRGSPSPSRLQTAASVYQSSAAASPMSGGAASSPTGFLPRTPEEAAELQRVRGDHTASSLETRLRISIAALEDMQFVEHLWSTFFLERSQIEVSTLESEEKAGRYEDVFASWRQGYLDACEDRELCERALFESQVVGRYFDEEFYPHFSAELWRVQGTQIVLDEKLQRRALEMAQRETRLVLFEAYTDNFRAVTEASEAQYRHRCTFRDFERLIRQDVTLWERRTRDKFMAEFYAEIGRMEIDELVDAEDSARKQRIQAKERSTRFLIADEFYMKVIRRGIIRQEAAEFEKINKDELSVRFIKLVASVNWEENERRQDVAATQLDTRLALYVEHESHVRYLAMERVIHFSFYPNTVLQQWLQTPLRFLIEQFEESQVEEIIGAFWAKRLQIQMRETISEEAVGRRSVRTEAYTAVRELFLALEEELRTLYIFPDEDAEWDGIWSSYGAASAALRLKHELPSQALKGYTLLWKENCKERSNILLDRENDRRFQFIMDTGLFYHASATRLKNAVATSGVQTQPEEEEEQEEEDPENNYNNAVAAALLDGKSAALLLDAPLGDFYLSTTVQLEEALRSNGIDDAQSSEFSRITTQAQAELHFYAKPYDLVFKEKYLREQVARLAISGGTYRQKGSAGGIYSDDEFEDSDEDPTNHGLAPKASRVARRKRLEYIVPFVFSVEQDRAEAAFWRTMLARQETAHREALVEHMERNDRTKTLAAVYGAGAGKHLQQLEAAERRNNTEQYTHTMMSDVLVPAEAWLRGRKHLEFFGFVRSVMFEQQFVVVMRRTVEKEEALELRRMLKAHAQRSFDLFSAHIFTLEKEGRVEFKSERRRQILEMVDERCVEHRGITVEPAEAAAFGLLRSQFVHDKCVIEMKAAEGEEVESRHVILQDQIAERIASYIEEYEPQARQHVHVEPEFSQREALLLGFARDSKLLIIQQATDALGEFWKVYSAETFINARDELDAVEKSERRGFFGDYYDFAVGTASQQHEELSRQYVEQSEAAKRITVLEPLRAFLRQRHQVLELQREEREARRVIAVDERLAELLALYSGEYVDAKLAIWTCVDETEYFFERVIEPLETLHRGAEGYGAEAKAWDLLCESERNARVAQHLAEIETVEAQARHDIRREHVFYWIDFTESQFERANRSAVENLDEPAERTRLQRYFQRETVALQLHLAQRDEAEQRATQILAPHHELLLGCMTAHEAAVRCCRHGHDFHKERLAMLQSLLAGNCRSTVAKEEVREWTILMNRHADFYQSQQVYELLLRERQERRRVIQQYFHLWVNETAQREVTTRRQVATQEHAIFDEELLKPFRHSLSRFDIDALEFGAERTARAAMQLTYTAEKTDLLQQLEADVRRNYFDHEALYGYYTHHVSSDFETAFRRTLEKDEQRQRGLLHHHEDYLQCVVLPTEGVVYGETLGRKRLVTQLQALVRAAFVDLGSGIASEIAKEEAHVFQYELHKPYTRVMAALWFRDVQGQERQQRHAITLDAVNGRLPLCLAAEDLQRRALFVDSMHHERLEICERYEAKLRSCVERSETHLSDSIFELYFSRREQIVADFIEMRERRRRRGLLLQYAFSKLNLTEQVEARMRNAIIEEYFLLFKRSCGKMETEGRRELVQSRALYMASRAKLRQYTMRDIVSMQEFHERQEAIALAVTQQERLYRGFFAEERRGFVSESVVSFEDVSRRGIVKDYVTGMCVRTDWAEKVARKLLSRISFATVMHHFSGSFVEDAKAIFFSQYMRRGYLSGSMPLLVCEHEATARRQVVEECFTGRYTKRHRRAQCASEEEAAECGGLILLLSRMAFQEKEIQFGNACAAAEHDIAWQVSLFNDCVSGAIAIAAEMGKDLRRYVADLRVEHSFIVMREQQQLATAADTSSSTAGGAGRAGGRHLANPFMAPLRAKQLRKQATLNKLNKDRMSSLYIIDEGSTGGTPMRTATSLLQRDATLPALKKGNTSLIMGKKGGGANNTSNAQALQPMNDLTPPSGANNNNNESGSEYLREVSSVWVGVSDNVEASMNSPLTKTDKTRAIGVLGALAPERFTLNATGSKKLHFEYRVSRQQIALDREEELGLLFVLEQREVKRITGEEALAEHENSNNDSAAVVANAKSRFAFSSLGATPQAADNAQKGAHPTLDDGTTTNASGGVDETPRLKLFPVDEDDDEDEFIDPMGTQGHKLLTVLRKQRAREEAAQQQQQQHAGEEEEERKGRKVLVDEDVVDDHADDAASPSRKRNELISAISSARSIHESIDGGKSNSVTPRRADDEDDFFYRVKNLPKKHSSTRQQQQQLASSLNHANNNDATPHKRRDKNKNEEKEKGRDGPTSPAIRRNKSTLRDIVQDVRKDQRHESIQRQLDEVLLGEFKARSAKEHQYLLRHASLVLLGVCRLNNNIALTSHRDKMRRNLTVFQKKCRACLTAEEGAQRGELMRIFSAQQIGNRKEGEK